MWAEHLGREMAANGFKRSRLDPGVFSKGRGKDLITATVHVDDMVIVGGRAAQQELIKPLKVDYELKHQDELEKGGDRAQLLGRTLAKTAKGFCFVNDPSYADDSAEIFNLDDKSKGVTTPAVNGSTARPVPPALPKVPPAVRHSTRAGPGL